MNRKRVLINVGLGGLIVVLGGAGALALMMPRDDPNANLLTATVQRGELQATVTASGNVESGAIANLQPGGGGVVTEVLVTTGQSVKQGDQLVRLDDTDAQAQLESALVGLRSAEASLTTATQGRTGTEREADAAGIALAEQNLKNAERAVTNARDNLALVKSQQAELVAAAQDAVTRAVQAVEDDQEQLAALKEQLAGVDPVDTAAVTALEGQIAQLDAELSAQVAARDSAKVALAQANRTRDTAQLQAEQGVTTQVGSRDAAKKTLTQQKATVAVNQQGPKQGNVDSAEAQVESAQLQVETARRAVEETVLLAPFDGVVSTINAVVGQPATGSASGSATGTTSTGSTGLVVLVAPDQLRVNASIAEADATSVQAGQPVVVNLPASGTDIAGTVSSIDIQSTLTNNVVQYLTTVSLTDPPAEVRVGQTASLSIITGSLEGVLFVPTSAITREGATAYVTRLADSVTERVEVRTGLIGTTGTEIVSGLEEGDEVVLPDASGAAAANPLAPSGESTP